MVSRFDVAAGKADFPAMAQCASIMSHFPRGSETLINVRPLCHIYDVIMHSMCGVDSNSQSYFMGVCHTVTLACDC